MDFTDPKKRLQQDLDDLHQDMDHKEKELKQIKAQIQDLQNRQELLEAELEEYYDKEKRLQQSIKRPA